MVLPMMKCWIDFCMHWSQLLAMRFLRRTHRPLKKLVYFPNNIFRIANLFGGGGTCNKWLEPLDYAPMELDSMGAH